MAASSSRLSTTPMTLSTWFRKIGLMDVEKLHVVGQMLGERKHTLMMESPPARGVVLPAGSTDAEKAHVTHRMGVALLFAGVVDEAEGLLRDAVEMLQFEAGERHKSTLAAKQTIAVLCAQSNRTLEAEPLFRECLEAYREELGSDDPDTLGAMNNLAELLKNTGRRKEAETLFCEALDAYKRVLGSRHPDTLGAMNNLAVLFQQDGRMDDLVALQRDASDAYDHVLGHNHPEAVSVKSKLADMLDDTDPRAARSVRKQLRALGVPRMPSFSRRSKTPQSPSSSKGSPSTASPSMAGIDVISARSSTSGKSRMSAFETEP